MSKPRNPSVEPPPPVDSLPPLEVIKARQLFQGKREIVIEHQGERYRLRITPRNKLILQK